MSTPATRTAARDFWNSAEAEKLGRIFDKAMEYAAVTAVLLLGSLNY